VARELRLAGQPGRAGPGWEVSPRRLPAVAPRERAEAGRLCDASSAPTSRLELAFASLPRSGSGASAFAKASADRSAGRPARASRTWVGGLTAKAARRSAAGAGGGGPPVRCELCADKPPGTCVRFAPSQWLGSFRLRQGFGGQDGWQASQPRRSRPDRARISRGQL